MINSLRNLPEYKFFIVGEGKSRKPLEKLVRKLKLETRCHFAGFRQDAWQYLSFYDIYALPSRSEGFSLALLEAAIYSVPTVASNLAVNMEAFTSEEVSFFNLKNPESISHAIINATGNKKMGDKMNHRFVSDYSPDLQYKRYLDIYQNRNSCAT